jgi:ADP-heptose:LPS heptosyltransferase
VALRRKLLTKKINRRSYLQHHLVDWEQMAEAVGLPWDTSAPWFQPLPGRLPAPVTAWLEAARARNEQAWLWHMGARWPGRQWPVERIRTVIQKFFLPRKIPLLLLQSPGEEIPPELAGIAPGFTPAGLPELITILNAGDFLVCNDTGVAHLGTALGKRVITIFGAGMPEWIAPFGNEDFIVRQEVCPHHPCLDRCVQPSFICRDAVTEEMVTGQIARVLASNQVSGRE